MKDVKYFFLQPKEEDVMKILWDSEEALSASEIANRIKNRDWPASSIQSILRNLEKKNAIQVASITKLGKSYGRLFRPTITANEYATMQFQRFYKRKDNDYLSLISSFIGNSSDDKEEIVNILHSLLEKYEKEI